MTGNFTTYTIVSVWKYICFQTNNLEMNLEHSLIRSGRHSVFLLVSWFLWIQHAALFLSKMQLLIDV